VGGVMEVVMGKAMVVMVLAVLVSASTHMSRSEHCNPPRSGCCCRSLRSRAVLLLSVRTGHFQVVAVAVNLARCNGRLDRHPPADLAVLARSAPVLNLAAQSALLECKPTPLHSTGVLDWSLQ
jgi:hypothetical protein